MATADTFPFVFAGAIAGQLCNLLMAQAAHIAELSDFVWSVFIPVVRVASTALLAYWLWQACRVRGSPLCLFDVTGIVQVTPPPPPILSRSL